MVRATAAIGALLLASSAQSAQAEPLELESKNVSGLPSDTQRLDSTASSPEQEAFDVASTEQDTDCDFRLHDIVNPFVANVYVAVAGFRVPNVDDIINPYRDEAAHRPRGFVSVPGLSYAELCRRYCQDPPRSVEPERAVAPPRAAQGAGASTPRVHIGRDAWFEERQSNADLRMLGGLVLAGTVLGATMLVAGGPAFDNEAGALGTSVLVGSGLVVGLALVTTGDKVELRFARRQVGGTH